MKVALVDNMNNNLFALARYFRQLGVDADLFLIPDSSHLHFAPKKDTWQELKKVSWLKEFPISYHWKNYLRPIHRLVRREFSAYDKVVACGPSIGLLHRAGIKVDLFIPYGSDLYNLPFCNKQIRSYKLFKLVFVYFLILYRCSLQKKGIQNSKSIISNANWKVAQQAVDRLGCQSTNFPRIMIYKEELPPRAFEKFAFFQKHDFVLFSPTRHLWKTNAEPLADFHRFGGAKRNDKIVEAFAQVVKEKLFSNPLLVLCEYGPDAEHTKNLVSELGLEAFVHWFPIMSRRELVAGISMATFVADQFREGMSATSAGTTNEALAYGTPVITNTDGAIHSEDDPYFGCPILEALKMEEIYEYFQDYAKKPSKYKKIGRLSEKWFDENLGEGLAQKYLGLLS
jgi:glycosyltransferase involved in cell wall biosynthesis